MSSFVDLEGRVFVPATELPISEWGCVLSDRAQPTLTLKDDDLFLIADTIGNISGCTRDEAITSMGLFCRDTRFLNRLELQINGRSPILLTSNADQGFALSALCTNPILWDEDKPTEIGIPAETISIQRELVLNGGLFEELVVHNYGPNTVKFQLSLSFDADFADLFEIRGFDRQNRGGILRRVAEDNSSPMSAEVDREYLVDRPTDLTLAYRGLDDAVLESHIEFAHQLPDYLKGYTAVWNVRLESHSEIKMGYRLAMLMNSKPVSQVRLPGELNQAKAAELAEEERWRSQITKIRCDNPAINQIIERAEKDVYLLRQSFEFGKILSAGVPWFCTLFGRDAIIAASQTLILDPTIAKETLLVLAQYQGKDHNDWRDEKPGKILHEIRLGEMARCNEIPHTPYYGTVDATPLWLMLYAEYYSWTHDREILDRLWENALAAMEWIDQEMEQTHGYLAYYQRSKRGLQNQGWKDSGNCIVDRYGKMAEGSISLCEVQAYVYAAKMRLSEIARTIRKEDHLADHWEYSARELKERFNRDFWVEDQDFLAMALDGEQKRVDGISSNPGQCLHLGILNEDKAQSVAERLMAPDLFSGWGIRTLSSDSPAYNPIGYHTGTVWPHDNSLITMGLRSNGFPEQALEVAQGLFDMIGHQPYHRPPELFCGYARNQGNPVQYPVACTPQAWATGTVFQLIQMMVNLVPNVESNQVRIIDPALPQSIRQLSIENLRVGATVLDVEFVRDNTQEFDRNQVATTSCRVTRKRGNLRVMIEA
jgi:glycogen debranching enzyme